MSPSAAIYAMIVTSVSPALVVGSLCLFQAAFATLQRQLTDLRPASL